MRKVKKIFKIILFLVVINIFGISDVSAATNPYKQTGPYGTNCTWYAWNMASEKAGVSLPGWGNAKNWYNDAKNSGYTVGTTPKANSIIVWGGWTSYGHVGYVEKVEGNVLYVWDSTGPCIDREDPEYVECIMNGVSEETDRICNQNAKRVACQYTTSPDLYGITGYIYLDYAPKKTTSTPTPVPTKTPSPTPSATSTPKPTPTPSIEVSKSSNTNLSNIVLSSGVIEFNKEVLVYNIEVENEVTKITINATLEDNKAQLKGTGDYELNVGLNEVKLTVTAEDGSTKDYTIQVERQRKTEIELDSDANNNHDEKVEVKNDNYQTMILLFSICFLVLVGIYFIFIFNRKNHNKNVKNK